MPDHDDAQQGAPLNREERRRRRFGPGGRETGAVPSDEPGPTDEAVARSANQGTLKLTGAGTGGATESDSRLAHHEGVHQPSRPNG